MKNYLVYDLGTGNSKVAIVTSEGNILSSKTIENEYHVDDNYEDAQYFDPLDWKKKLLKTTKDIISENPRIKIDAITAAGARQSIVVLDKDLNSLYGLPNIDNRGKKWVGEISEAGEVYKVSGKWLTEDFPAAKLLGFKKVYQDLYSKARSFTSLSEWIGLIFTGKLCIEPSQACETQLYDINKHEWSEYLINKFDLNKLEMPNTLPGGTSLGRITKDIRDELKIDEDAEFIVGGADTQVAIMGANISEGDIGIVSGTTSPVVYLSDKIIYDKDENCWVDCFLGDDNYVIETNPGVSGLNYQIIKNLLFNDVSYETIEEELKKVKSIKLISKLTSLDFENKGGYKWGGFLMKPPLKGNLKKIDFAWSVVADIASAITYQCNNLINLIGARKKYYLLGCGGGFQSKTMCQHLADLSGIELRIPKGYSQASILGLVKLLNKVYNIEGIGNLNEFIVYKPQKGNLIHEYYKKWLSANNLVR